MRHGIGWLAAMIVATGTTAWADDGAKARAPIPPAQAKDHIGETLTVRMTVKHAKDAIHEKSYFLDSEPDYKDPNNLAVVIAYEHAQAFKDAGIADPAAHFEGKTIDVTGKVIKESQQTRIRVTEPKQIVIVEKGKRSP
jgi:hypothetical protein